MLEELEQARKKALLKQLISIGVAILVCIIAFIVFGPHLFGIGLFVGIILASFIPRKDINAFKTLYKQNIVVKSLNQICTDVAFDMQKGINRSVIAETEMMNMGDHFYSNDYVTGKYKNINFEMADVHIEEESTDSDGNTTYYTIFRGQWYIFDFNKTFKANVQVCEKGFGNAKRGKLFAKKEEKYKKVELEDIEFNKMYKVYAQNELDAFYILTPGIMEKIKNVNAKIKGKVLFCFIDNKLHIGLYNNKDLFEASIYKKIDLDAAMKKTNEEISIITDFVDILSLDNDLFKN